MRFLGRRRVNSIFYQLRETLTQNDAEPFSSDGFHHPHPHPSCCCCCCCCTASEFSFFSHVLKECTSLLHLRSAQQQITVRGLLASPNSRSGSSLGLGAYILSAYVARGALDEALSLLQQLSLSLSLSSSTTTFWWHTLMKKDGGNPHRVLHLCRRMHLLGIKPNQFVLPCVLKACGDLSSFAFGTSMHAFVCTNGYSSNVYVSNTLISLYARCGALQDAHNLFGETISGGIADVVTWNSIIRASVQNGCMHMALGAFRRMMYMAMAGNIRPDAISLVNVLPACSSLKASDFGKQIHAFAFKSGLIADLFVGNALLLHVYAKCQMMGDARRAFDAMEVKDVVSWNAMVTGYSQSGDFDRALELLNKMREEHISLDVVTWSALIAGYSQRGRASEAIHAFRQMQKQKQKQKQKPSMVVEPNAITITSLLSACASKSALRWGMEAHAYALRRCFLSRDAGNHLLLPVLVHNALIDMYSKCGNTAAARTIFDMTWVFRRDVITWTAMIGGYAQHGDPNSALQLFSQMLLSGGVCSPNNFTIACLLIACARLSTLHFGKQAHAFVIRNFRDPTETFIANCLIDMYSKCGDVGSARTVFNSLPGKNDVSWTSLMTAYAMHGRVKDALCIFRKMREEVGVVPDAITLLVVLYACSHAGMVEDGLRIFRNMDRDYGIVATVQHYACVVDLLGRAGRLQEAKELIDGMPMEPTVAVWMALLNACRIHSDVKLGEVASQRLLDAKYEGGGGGDGSYTLLSNIYADAKRWKDVARTRGMMKDAGVKKRPGCSWIHGGNKGASTFVFFVGDRSHPQWVQIYATLAKLMHRIKEIGYEPITDFALHDVDEEEKSCLLVEHSEKLALAFGIMTVPPGAPIRITKNLRVCGDCHSAFTFISKIVDHEIILRDSSRFHHFKEGTCSCGGYW